MDGWDADKDNVCDHDLDDDDDDGNGDDDEDCSD